MATGKIRSEIVTDASTSDVLTDALLVGKTTIFKGSGSSYTGTVPNNNIKYGTFIVLKRSTDRFVLGFDSAGNVYSTAYNGSSWSGWVQLNTAAVTSVSATTSSGVTGSVNIDRTGNNFATRIDVSFATAGVGWNEVAVLPFSPSRNYYGVVSTTTGTCKLAIITYTGKVQILGPSVNVEYIGTISGMM